MLTKIAAKNYKNLDLADGINLSNLNILVGPNGSGKSNLIALIEFLKNCLTPVDSSRGVTAFEDAVYKLGGTKSLDGRLEKPSVMTLEFEQGDLESIHKISDSLYELDLLVQNNHSSIIIKRESLYSTYIGCETEQIYSYQDKKFMTLKDVPLPDISSNELILNQLTRFGNIAYLDYVMRGKKLSDIEAFIDAFLFHPLFNNTHIYNANDMDLYKIRTDSPKTGGTDLYLSRSGNNLPLVLDNLIQESLDFEESLNNAMQRILPTTRKVRPIRVGRLSLTIEWHVEGMNEPFYLDEMSDGTVRMLCWVTLLFSPKLPALLIIEEPELGIHVAWLPILADWIKQAAERTQVIISTHSPDLLDQFSDRVENVYVFHPTAEDKNHFKVKQLSQQDVDSWFKEGWQLGDLYRVGDPSVGGWPW